jgi:hypothetical protein
MGMDGIEVGMSIIILFLLAIGRLSENLYIMGNEPSQAMYCIQVRADFFLLPIVS